MKIKFIIFTLSLCYLLVLNISAEQISVNSILATVDGEAITLMDVLSETKAREERIFSVYAGTPTAEEIEKIRKDALELLIEEKLILNEFRRRSYTVPPKMVERMLDALSGEFAGGGRARLFEMAEMHRISHRKLRKKIEDRAAIELMLNEFSSRHISVSPKEIQERLDILNKAKKSASKVELFVIFISRDKENESKKSKSVKKINEEKAKNNKSIFMTLAKLYSEDRSASDGGSLGWLEKEKLRPEFAEALKNLKPGESSEAIQTEEGTYFVYLAAEKSQYDTIPSYDELRDTILAEKRDAEKKEFTSKLRKNAIIKYFH